MLSALIEVLQRGAVSGHRPSSQLAALALHPPAGLERLLSVLADHRVRLDLGWRSIETRYLGRLTDTLDTLDDVDPDARRLDDLVHGVQLGASAGGEVYFGVYVKDGVCRAVEIDLEDSYVRWFDSVSAYFDEVLAQERKRGSVPTGLAALFAADGRPLQDAAPPADEPASRGLVPWTGAPVPDPMATARAHFGDKSQLMEMGPGSGALPQHRERRVAALGPGRAKALLCTGSPGPLVEVDLETLAVRDLVDDCAWSCGFVAAIVDGQPLVGSAKHDGTVVWYALQP